jgi:hypothetical protein
VKVTDLRFSQMWALDFEFKALTGERPQPLCLVAREIKSGSERRYWVDDLVKLSAPPFPPDALLIAYYASAEMGCFLSLNWNVDYSLLDLFTEFRQQTNGLELVAGNGLLGALLHHGLPAMNVEEKDEMRQLALRDGLHSPEEREALLDYCASDVRALESLLPKILAPMTPNDLERAILRGRYMRAAAKMEFVGVPMDTELLGRLNESWAWLKEELITELDANYGVYDNGVFRASRWAGWCQQRSIDWPITTRGTPKLDDETFKEIGRGHPEVETMRQLRHAQGQLRLNDLAVGTDGRNRQILSAFRAKTSRNQPSNAAFVFGPAVWMRGLIRPRPGWAIAYVDWEQQEFGIAAYLSGDANMITAYESADPYLEFAKLAGAVPINATRETHSAARERFKQCVLAVQYGMGVDGLAHKAGISAAEAEQLLRLHRVTFSSYWAWSDGILNHALIHRRLHTVFGWQIQLPFTTHDQNRPNERSLRNFPIQANGAEMLRLACILSTEAGLEICAPVHDALLLHAPIERVEQQVRELQDHMAHAANLLLGKGVLRTDAKVFRYPERYADRRGSVMWDTVGRLLAGAPQGVQQRNEPVHHSNKPVR